MKTTVPLLDLRAQFDTLRGEIWAALEQVVESQQFILGPEVEGLEREIAAFCQARCAIGCASGSDALLLALKAMDIGTGDEVITSPYTFFATAGAVKRVGARPVFVDIDPVSFNIDPAAVEDAITPQTTAIIPVHLFGQTAEMEPLLGLAVRYGLGTVEDACQAIGAEHRGRRAGTLGIAAAFSFFPSKNLGGFGDGGMVTTDDDSLAAKMRTLRVHGMDPKYYHRYVGFNARLDALQAAVLRVKLRHLDRWNAARQANARRYAALFEDCGLDGFVTLPVEAAGMRHVFHQYVVRVPAAHRAALRQYLADRGVGTEVYYPVPLHLQECFRSLGYKPGAFPHAEAAAAESIALPIYPELTEHQQAHVVDCIRQFAAQAARRAHKAAA